MRRFTFALASATLAVATLAACGGGDSDEAYCDAVDAAGKKLNDVAAADDLGDAIDSLKKVRDEASGETKENWDTLVSSIETLQGGDTSAAEDLDQDKIREASDQIVKQVKDTCDIDLEELN
ncbi:hypothetical protein [Mumia sp. Pv 4-285]|uniref:hypothetical protein n=1 Tax=Mumia qirimensis TaxID=3234852 RepID=UPI00351D8514